MILNDGFGPRSGDLGPRDTLTPRNLVEALKLAISLMDGEQRAEWRELWAEHCQGAPPPPRRH